MGKASIIILFFFTSCMTAKKAESYLNNDKVEAAKYCSETFPVIEKQEEKKVAVDSTHYKEAYEALSQKADSIFYRLDSLEHASTPEHPYKPNMDSLRAVVDKRIREGLKPCKDSIVTITVTKVDRARESYLQGMVDQKDATITKQQTTIADKDHKIAKQAKWVWYFWILVAALGLYTFLKIKKIL